MKPRSFLSSTILLSCLFASTLTFSREEHDHSFSTFSELKKDSELTLAILNCFKNAEHISQSTDQDWLNLDVKTLIVCKGESAQSLYNFAVNESAFSSKQETKNSGKTNEVNTHEVYFGTNENYGSLGTEDYRENQRSKCSKTTTAVDTNTAKITYWCGVNFELNKIWESKIKAHEYISE